MNRLSLRQKSKSYIIKLIVGTGNADDPAFAEVLLATARAGRQKIGISSLIQPKSQQTLPNQVHLQSLKSSITQLGNHFGRSTTGKKSSLGQFENQQKISL